MITYVRGDLFQSPAKVLVNTVNTVGAMGKGIASDFKHIYPEMFAEYQKLCEKGQFKVGQLWLFKTTHKWILNFPTKEHWRNKSRPEYIEAGLKKFVASYDERGISSVSFPMLGCGNGELDWETQVHPLMEKYLDRLPIDIYIHVYRGSDLAPEHRDIEGIKKWLRGEPRALAFSEFWDDLTAYIGEGRNLKTPSQDTSFAVTVASNPIILTIIPSSGKPILIDESQLVDFWQNLRSAGYSMSRNFPAGLHDYAPFIVSIFSELDYIRPVQLSRTDRVSETYIGLQLIPMPEEHEPDKRTLELA